MTILLVSDVFGKTPALNKLSKELDGAYIVDPYDGIDMKFKNESQAYTYFIKNIGLDLYLEQLHKAVKSLKNLDGIVGFSVGASAIWRLSENTSINFGGRAICFYGTQIRNYKEIKPRFGVDLVFPEMETHFDVSALRQTLATSQNVNATQVKYLHGFMNYHSKNYSPIAYKEQVEHLLITFRAKESKVSD